MEKRSGILVVAGKVMQILCLVQEVLPKLRHSQEE